MPILRGIGHNQMQPEPCILLTGGTGFVGRYLAPALSKRFAQYRRILLCHADNPGGDLSDWHCEQADITNETAVADIVARCKPEAVIHLAAQASVAQGAGAAEATWRVNFGGSLALASAVARHAPQALFFFASSSDVYGQSFRLGPATEDTPPWPASTYAASKLAAEMMLRDVLPASCRLIVARAFNHSGPGQDERFVLPSFAAQIARIEAGLCEPRLMIGNLDAERDFMHVADVIDAYMQLLERANTLPSRALFNVASGRVFRIGDLLDILGGLSRTPFSIETDPNRMRPSEIARAAGDASKLRNATGWKPNRPLPETLRELLDWWRAEVTKQH